MHSDTQGNIIAISDANADIINRRSYTPFGEIRHIEYKEGISNALNSLNITNRGYSGHEHIDNTELIHMNGRVYDPTIGRFMSADPFIQAPTDTQSYNRYSYVRNNPVNLTDPSGYNWISKQWKKWAKPILAIAAAAIITFYTAGAGGASLGAAWASFFSGTTGAMAAGALAGGVAGAIMTGSVQGTLKGALWGAIGAGVAQGIGHAKSFSSIAKSMGGYGRDIAHGLSRGLISKLQGGTFRAGFYSGFASSAFSPGTTMGGDGAGGFALRTSMAGIVAGTASELGGGKFANGAVTAAFVHMFNSEGIGSLDKALKSFTDGLYGFGDYAARLIGLRDVTNGLVIDALTGGNYYQEQAIFETKAIGILGEHAISNPSLTMDAVKIYVGHNDGQLRANSLVTFSAGLAVPGVGVISFIGNTMRGAHKINNIYESIRK